MNSSQVKNSIFSCKQFHYYLLYYNFYSCYHCVIESLIESEESGTFDFIYVDGDKLNADVIYELSLKLLRTNGIIAFDNVSSHCKNCILLLATKFATILPPILNVHLII